MNRHLQQSDVRHIVHSYMFPKPLNDAGPRIMGKGKGIFVYDDAGKPYLEAMSGMWCTSLGFGEPALIDAAMEQFHQLPYYHLAAGKSNNPAIELAERLAKLVPIQNAKINFAVSGSEANDFLIKFVRFYNNAIGRPQKKKIISRINAYHGATMMTTSLTGIPANHRNFDLPLPGVLHLSCPHYFRNAHPGESPQAFTDRLVEEIETLIAHEGADTIAAFIAEPVMGPGGVIIAPPGYFERIQAILKQHDILFLADEVVTGFYRTGPLWGCEAANIQPDTMSLAKGLTSAYQPLSAIVLSEDIFAGMQKGAADIGWLPHGTTYAGHPVACAVALKVLDLMQERNIDEHVRNVAPIFQERLARFRQHPLVGDVRGIGLMGAVEFVQNKEKRTFFNPAGIFSARLKQRAEDAYQLIVRSLPGCDAIAFSPPLIITEVEVHELFDRFEKALDDVTAEVCR